jgi:hypothetical protein
LSAHEIITTKLTWTQEISRIVFRRCASCHGEKASIPLITYDEARPWAKAIRDEVLERRMPPWGAVKGFGEFKDDPSLSQVELDLIVGWVEGGAPKGDDIYLPQAPRTTPAPARPFTRGVEVKERTVLAQPLTAAGIRPRQLPEGGWMQVTASLPGGAVRPLIWLRNYPKKWERAYWFRQPLDLPRGSAIRVESSEPGATAVILAAKPAP